ncbi:MAG: flavodoxin family protein [Candidatus Omnitrophota bacterium]
MKVIVVNASPKKDKGITGLILAPFLEGMREAGANVELFYTRDLYIQPCLGKFNCWLRNPGTCCQHDDMDWLRFKYEKADITVLATPLYADGMAGPLKNFIDRLIPFAKPTLELRDGHCRHPWRGDFKPGSLALVSNCGFWEMDNFDP